MENPSLRGYKMDSAKSQNGYGDENLGEVLSQNQEKPWPSKFCFRQSIFLNLFCSLYPEPTYVDIIHEYIRGQIAVCGQIASSKLKFFTRDRSVGLFSAQVR